MVIERSRLDFEFFVESKGFVLFIGKKKLIILPPF